MKTALIIALVLILLGLALAVGAFAASGFDLTVLGGAKLRTNTYTADGAFTKIQIRLGEGDVCFRPAEDGRCTVVCAEKEKLLHRVTVEDGTLIIKEQDDRKWMDHLTLFTSGSVTVTVYLPAEEYEALSVRTSTGDVTITEPFRFGSIQIKGGTGDLTIEKTRTGELDLSVSTGKVHVTSVDCAGDFSLSVSTGKSWLTDVTCRSFRSDGSTGDLTMKNVIASGSFQIRRGTGDVHFESCDAGSITVETSTGEVTGTLRTPKVFSAKASTGKIRVPDTKTGGPCQITTSTGDIEITIE